MHDILNEFSKKFEFTVSSMYQYTEELSQKFVVMYLENNLGTYLEKGFWHKYVHM